MATTKPIIQIGDEVREMNDAEYAQYKIDEEWADQLKADMDAKAAAKASALAKLGLTADEAAALLG